MNISDFKEGMMKEERLMTIVGLGESSRLKTDLNEGIAALFEAEESHFQPHVSLNGEHGVPVLQRIADRPSQANTEFVIRAMPDISVDRLWLNVTFNVYLDNICWPHYGPLSPRQTAYVVQNLPPQSRTIVLAKVRRWYFEQFLVDIKKALDRISEQLNRGNPLVDDYEQGRVFDIHTQRNVPYTECLVVGEALYWNFLAAGTCLEVEEDLFAKADMLITTARSRQRGAVDGLLGLMRGGL